MRKILFALTIATVLTAAASAAKPIQRMYVFGDSYSDIGRGYIDTDGPTAVAYLAQKLNLVIVPSNAPDSSTKSLDFAVSGASTGENPGHTVPRGWLGLGMKNQVAEFIAMAQSHQLTFNAATTIFFIAGGLNDRHIPTEETVSNLESEVASLYAVGGRHFLIATLPEKIPAFSEVGVRLNPALKTIPTDLRPKFQDATIDTTHWGDFFDIVMSNAASYGFTDTQNQCSGRAIFNEDTTPCASPATHFYFHKSHPSTAVNKLVGDMLYNEVVRLQ